MNHYVRPFRCARRCQSRATVRYETGPGEQLQHDWAQCWVTMAGIERKVFFAVNTLDYSRRFHVVAGFSLDAEHTDESLVQSFTYFGGVPRTVLVDNQKAAVLSHTPQGIRFHPRFLDLAGHYGFTPKACRSYRARTKGKVERRVRYVKEHFFVRYPAFESVAHLNQQLLGWLSQEADTRIHGTHGQPVIERFNEEHSALGGLPSRPYDTSYHQTRAVSWDGYIEVRGNRYSVPAPLCGHQVAIRISLNEILRVIDNTDTLVATHRLYSPYPSGGQSPLPITGPCGATP